MTTGYVRVLKHGHPNAAADGRVLEHVFVMSVVLGRALTALEVVHHIDEDKSNNSPKNLMLFASQAEHLLHHAKERALAACGNASFMKCQFCKEYDDPAKMYVRKNNYQAWHRACCALHDKQTRPKRNNKAGEW